MKKPLLILLILAFFSCSKKEPKEIQKKTTDSFSITAVDSCEFRRNYFYPDTISEKERKKLDKRNPEIVYGFSKKNRFYDGLNKLNLFEKDGSLIEKTWNTFTEKAEQKGSIKIANVNYQYTIKLKDEYIYNLILTNKKNQIVLTKEFDFGHAYDHGFLIKDLDGNGTDEIILFNHWYIVNGDNYDIQINTIG